MGAEIKVNCSATSVRYTLYIIITSMMQQFVNELIEWSRQQAMSMNGYKSNEMLIGRIHKVEATVVAGPCRDRPSENVQTSWSPCLS